MAPPFPPTEQGMGAETAEEQNRTRICSKNAMCSFVVCQPTRHLSTFYLNQKMQQFYYMQILKKANKIKIRPFLAELWAVLCSSSSNQIILIFN